jgi:very-short-patch-repair endonuclease
MKDIKPNLSYGLDYYIRKYGKENGPKFYQEKINKQKGKGSLSWYISKYGESDGLIKYQEKNKRLSVSTESLKNNGFTNEEIVKIKDSHKSKSARTLENYILQYGEIEGVKKYEEMKLNRVCVRRFEYWVGRGFSEDEAKKIVHNFQSRTLESFVEKYGEHEGKLRYEKFSKGRVSSLKKGLQISKLETQIYNSVVLFYEDARQSCVISKYTVDIFIPSLNLIIEIYGDYWHCNPLYWSENEYHKNMKCTAKKKWERDQSRIEQLKNLGYKVLIIWESSLKKNDFNLKETIDESCKTAKII